MTDRTEKWADLRWLVVFNGIADACIWPFEVEGWVLTHGDPANGMLGILPRVRGGDLATMDDALWLADVMAFDHDAPVAVIPAVQGAWPLAIPKDVDAVNFMQPVEPFFEALARQYWDSVQLALGAAADLRFNASYCLRYDSSYPDPGTNFTERFEGRGELVSLYAMGARQADILAEYLCLYRVLEGADGGNGTEFSERAIPTLLDRDFGLLRVIPTVQYSRPNVYTDVFALYKHRARMELHRLGQSGIVDVPRYNYDIRNRIAHGKSRVAGGNGRFFEDRRGAASRQAVGPGCNRGVARRGVRR